jgi:glycosyltransferase involved in cell wall biosynthesis
MKRADVFVSLSKYEGNPNAVLEAMACRCPVVLSDIPAHREICDLRSAAFADASCPHSVAKNILRLLTHRHAALQQAEQARQYVEIRSIPEMALEYVRVYEMLLRHKGRHFVSTLEPGNSIHQR